MPVALLKGFATLAGGMQANPAGMIRKIFQLCVLTSLIGWSIFATYGYILARGGEPQREDRIWKINIPIAWDEVAPTIAPETEEVE